MADTSGKDTPSTDPKRDDKTGPVKPPVLEGTARPAAGAKPKADAEPASAAPKPDASKPAPPKPAAAKPAAAKTEPSPSGGAAPWLAGLVGGLIGLGAAYGLAWFGLWPAPAQTPPADPRIGQFATALPQLQAEDSELKSALSALTSRLSGLETELAALPASAASDDSALAERLDALAAQVDNLAATPAAPSDAGAADDNAAAIAALETELAALRQEASDTNARLDATESRIENLAENASANAQAESGAVRLPLIFSSLETAFAAGRPYETELTALRQAAPDATVPEAISAHVGTGLPRSDDVARRLDAVVPDMLAGRPADAEASWQAGAMDWMRGVVAMRPAEAVEGEGPDAMIARLEAAVARRDFTAAQAELDSLPAPMRAAAGPVATDIATLASADAFLAGLRAQALGAEQNP